MLNKSNVVQSSTDFLEGQMSAIVTCSSVWVSVSFNCNNHETEIHMVQLVSL